VPDLAALAARFRGAATQAAGVVVTGARRVRAASRSTRAGSIGEDLGRGVALHGTVWAGGDAPAYRGVVVVDPTGRVAAAGPVREVRVPAGVRTLGGAGCWIGPGVVDAHVHLAFGAAEQALRGGVVAVRDLGAPRVDALRWRTGHRTPPPGRPYIGVAGPILTAPGGYPSRSWGAAGFAAFVGTPGAARLVVRSLAGDGVDLVKVALEAGADGRWPLPPPPVVHAVVEAAHGAGLRVTAHALTVEAVTRALDAGVDELAHTPTERLPEAVVDRIAAAGIPVVSTLQTFFSGGAGRPAAANAAALHRAGVPLVYGTDLGNAGTRPGVDPRELDRLADAGLGRRGALLAATTAASGLPGVRGRNGRITVGEPAALVLLAGDPLVEPGVWHRPLAVLCDGRLVQPGGPTPETLDRTTRRVAPDELLGR
jgi:imidazolonepropionase-like amidohydrolase